MYLGRQPDNPEVSEEEIRVSKSADRVVCAAFLIGVFAIVAAVVFGCYFAIKYLPLIRV